MDDYAGRVLADRYRLPLPPDDAYETVETRAFDTYSGQEVLVRQVPLPEVVDAEVLDAEDPAPAARRATGGAVRMPADPAVRRAVEAAQAAAQVPDHPRLDQVFDVFAEAGSLWIVSELVAARPLASLLAERPLNPFRAAEIGSDVLTALRVLHAHGWTHRNITVRTVLICDDGRVVLTGLAAGAAEEALCGYVTTPQLDEDEDEDEDGYEGSGGYGIERDHGYEGGGYEAGFGRPALGTGSAGVFAPPLPPLPPPPAEVPASRGPAAIETGGRPATRPPMTTTPRTTMTRTTTTRMGTTRTGTAIRVGTPIRMRTVIRMGTVIRTTRATTPTMPPTPTTFPAAARETPRSCGPGAPEPSSPTARAPAPPHTSARTDGAPRRATRRTPEACRSSAPHGRKTRTCRTHWASPTRRT